MKYANTLGLLGQNISYSLSPWIHHAAAQAVGVPHQYRLFDLEPEAVGPFLREFWLHGGVGLNVTQPYKREVAKWVQSSLVATNTLYRDGLGTDWRSVSTDGEGFLQALDSIWGKNSFSHWVFLGNGGVVSSILDAARCLTPCPQISIVRRDPQLDGALEGIYPGVRFFPFSPPALQEVLALGSCLLIQASTAPAATWASFSNVLDVFSGCCMDLAYGPRSSSLYFALKEQRHPCEDGLAMLLEQARIAQKFWWGRAPSREDLIAAMIEMAPQYGMQWKQYNKEIQRLATM
jgi:shikimate dehydrogenase